MNNSRKKIIALIGAMFFIIPAILFILWIYACNETEGYPKNVELYNSYLPQLLRGRFTTTLMSLVSCVIAIGLNVVNLNNTKKVLKALSWFVVIASGLLAFLNLFSMM